MQVVFVSHQWLGFQHPDPNFEQFGILQTALKELIAGTATVAFCGIKSVLFGQDKPQLYGEKAKALADAYIWYDYFSVPQIKAGCLTCRYTLGSPPPRGASLGIQK